MASIKNLKKDINYVLGDVIDECLVSATGDIKKIEAIVDEAIVIFDELIAKVNAKNIENKVKTTDDNNDITQQLKDLNELYKSGALTKEEFAKAKKKLLN